MTLLDAITQFGELPDPCINNTTLSLSIKCHDGRWIATIGEEQALRAGGSPCGGKDKSIYDVIEAAVNQRMTVDDIGKLCNIAENFKGADHGG